MKNVKHPSCTEICFSSSRRRANKWLWFSPPQNWKNPSDNFLTFRFLFTFRASEKSHNVQKMYDLAFIIFEAAQYLVPEMSVRKFHLYHSREGIHFFFYKIADLRLEWYHFPRNLSIEFQAPKIDFSRSTSLGICENVFSDYLFISSTSGTF